MQTLTQKLTVAVLAVLLALVAVVALPSRSHAQDAEEQPAEESQQSEAAKTYNYTAQKGDSYSLIARKAVQTYGIISTVNLSGAQIIAAETYLTQAAGSPVLNQGQAVTVNESDVKAAVEKAQALSEAAQKLWQKYADRANFNTNNVGEARS